MSNFDQNLCESVLLDVLHERRRQHSKWGEQNHDDGTWALILQEEVGEWGEACLDQKFSSTSDERALEEIIQVAAVAVQIAEIIYRRRGRPVIGKETS